MRRAGDPNLPLRSALRFSQPLGGLLRRRFRGLVSSRSHVQGSSRAVQGFLPIRSGSRLVDGPCPLAVRPLALTGDPAATRSASASRLRSAERCVPKGRGLACPSVAPLFGFLLLRDLDPPPSARLPVAGPSARDVASTVFFAGRPFRARLADLAASGRLQRVVGGLSWRRPSPRRRPVRGFEPSVLPLALPVRGGSTVSAARLLGDGRGTISFGAVRRLPVRGT